MYLYSNALVAFALGAFMMGRAANAQDTPPATYFNGIEWKNDATEQTSKLSMTRNLVVPAPCWRAPWNATVPELTPYFRDRFVLDWSERGVNPDIRFYISIYIQTADDTRTEYKSTKMYARDLSGTVVEINRVSNYQTYLGTEVLVGINKYANNAIFVYSSEAAANNVPARDDPGETELSSIDDCNASNRQGCWALPIPRSDQITSISFGIHASDYNPGVDDPTKTYELDKTKTADLKPIPDADLAHSDGKGLVYCDASNSPPIRRMARRRTTNSFEASAPLE